MDKPNNNSPEENIAVRMYLAPASAELCLYLSKATNAAIGIEAVSSPIKNIRKFPDPIMKLHYHQGMFVRLLS